jgi:hypothetical protein
VVPTPPSGEGPSTADLSLLREVEKTSGNDKRRIETLSSPVIRKESVFPGQEGDPFSSQSRREEIMEVDGALEDGVAA